MRRSAWTVAAVAIVVASSSLAWAGEAEAAKAFAEGKALLAKADFDGALAAYKSAAKADPDNKDIVDSYLLLRRVVQNRTQLKAEQDKDRWLEMAPALLDFYLRNHIVPAALELAGELHAKANTAASTVLLATAQIDAGKDGEAAKLLTDLPAERQSPRATVLRGVALAHQGQGEAAQAIAKDFELPKDADADLQYDVARLYSLTGHADKACVALTTSFEATPGPALPGVKTATKESKDFAAVAQSEAFTKALTTESKVKSCGSAAGCGGCANKNKCSSGGKEGSKDEGCKDHEKKEAKPGKS
jgi:tetratricopeptide (TPR) repeat protein